MRDPREARLRELLLGSGGNRGRWGDDDARGTLNLVGPEHVISGVEAVRSGEVLSLSRVIATEPGAGNPHPAQHFLQTVPGGDNSFRRPENPGGKAFDFYGISYHGLVTTHIDALAHVWNDNGLYNGRDQDEHLTGGGSTWGGIEEWREGVVTRCHLLDVPRFRGTGFVTDADPVEDEELEAILAADGIDLRPGDAIAVHCGRERWQRAHPDRPYGFTEVGEDTATRRRTRAKPGLGASCVFFLRRHDVAALVWDMLDATPYEYDLTYTVHGAIPALGLALVDNAVLDDLAQRCAERGSPSFLLMVAPLVVAGGTGSPVNPLAVL